MSDGIEAAPALRGYIEMDDADKLAFASTASQVVGEFIAANKPDPSYNIFAEANNPVELLGMCMGYAGMCWENVSEAGEFDSRKAQLGLEHAINRLAQLSDQAEEAHDVASGVSDEL